MIVSDRNRLVASLVNCSLSLKSAMHLPSSGMSGCQPMHEARERAVDVGREQKMPVVWHHTVRKKRNAVPVDSRNENVLERGVVSCSFKESRTFRSSVDDVKEQTRSRSARASGHDRESNAMRVPSVENCVSVLIK